MNKLDRCSLDFGREIELEFLVYFLTTLRFCYCLVPCGLNRGVLFGRSDSRASGFFALGLWFTCVQLEMNLFHGILTGCHNWLISSWFTSAAGEPKVVGAVVICVLA